MLAERFSGGWRATVNGALVEVVRAEFGFMGCVVPAGCNTVEFRFEPVSVSNGRRISLLVVVLLAVFAGARFLTRR